MKEKICILLENQNIKKLNDEVNELCGYNSNDILLNLKSLIKSGEVIVGWRESCGKTDRTMKIFRVWKKAVKELKKNGAVLKEERILDIKNSSPTSAGGFWNEIKYYI